MSKLKSKVSSGLRGAPRAQRSSTSQTQMFDSDITICCWVLGDEYYEVFPVEIPGNKSVAHLKRAIKAENPTTMKDIDAKKLILYAVSVPHTPQLAQRVAELRLDGLGLNSHLGTLSEAFDDGLLDGHVHVVIKTPGVWAYNHLSTLHLHVSQLHSCHLVSVEFLRTPHNLQPLIF